MPDHILELAAEEYLDIQKMRKNEVPFHYFLRNWLKREGYREHIQYT